MIKCTIYMGFTKFIDHILYSLSLSLSLHIESLMSRRKSNYPHTTLNDQNTTYVFPPKVSMLRI